MRGRHPGATLERTSSEALTPPSMAVLALTRLAFGPTSAEIAAFDALGGSDLARLTAWVDQQLNPAAQPDS